MPLGVEKLEKVWLPTTASLPEDQREYALINVTLTTRTFLGLEKYETVAEQSASALVNAIKEWNVKKSASSTETADITVDNILALDVLDFAALKDALNAAESTQVTGVEPSLKEI
jgi:bacillopeptidase F (M6 metalloprotease family)